VIGAAELVVLIVTLLKCISCCAAAAEQEPKGGDSYAALFKQVPDAIHAIPLDYYCCHF
jgi:hypothetical protein